MKIIFSLSILAVLFFSCKKNDNVPDLPVNITIADSAIEILSVEKTDINEFNIKYAVKPPPNETFNSIFLCWSTSADFVNNNDSVSISTTLVQPVIYHITKLKETTKYFGRIGMTYKGKRFYSPVKEWNTDSLKIIGAGYFGLLRGLNKMDTTFAWTNLQAVIAITGSDTKILLGNYECPIISDQGLTIQFSVPSTIPVGKYALKIKTRGMEAQASDSTEVLRGDWSTVTSPPIPINPNANTSGLFNFGTCNSAQKGYILGGNYFNGPQVAWPNSQWPEFIFEFDDLQRSWTKKYPSTARYFDNPICYYYNNSIYVIGAAKQFYIDQFGFDHGMLLKRMQRLDLGSLTWSDMDSVPYPTLFNLTSFELNNEWYVGGGADSANVTVCCGTPIPSKKFWKYNPATNQWMQIADFPGGYQVNPTSFSIGSKGYSFYGAVPVGDPIIATDFTQQFWEYNPAANAWTNIPLPAVGGPPKGEKYSIVSYNNKAYFLSAQVRVLTGLGYGYNGLNVCLEWDPTNTTIYKYVAFPQGGDIFKCYFKNGNRFYFQSDALGYFTSIPNRTYSFFIEQ